jgi:hypothetical protein
MSGPGRRESTRLRIVHVSRGHARGSWAQARPHRLDGSELIGELAADPGDLLVVEVELVGDLGQHGTLLGRDRFIGGHHEAAAHERESCSSARAG